MSPANPPNDTELDLLKLFWKDGSLSAREVQDRLPDGLDWTGSTTRTVLERMRTKGLLDRRAVHGVAVYQAAQAKVDVLGGVLRRLMRGVLEVDGRLPASAFSGSQVLSAEEIEALEAVLNAPEGGEGAAK